MVKSSSIWIYWKHFSFMHPYVLYLFPDLGNFQPNIIFLRFFPPFPFYFSGTLKMQILTLWNFKIQTAFFIPFMVFFLCSLSGFANILSSSDLILLWTKKKHTFLFLNKKECSFLKEFFQTWNSNISQIVLTLISEYY